jgi:hypothetical protein
MKRNWIRKILGGLSLTSALFVFQACYGTPQDFGLDLLVEGQVKSKTSGLPIEGIQVTISETSQHEITDENGTFSLYTEKLENLTIKFEDIDSTQNGFFIETDTILKNNSGRVYLDIILEDK